MFEMEHVTHTARSDAKCFQQNAIFAATIPSPYEYPFEKEKKMSGHHRDSSYVTKLL